MLIFTNWCLARKSTIWSLTNISNNLPIADVKLTGLLFSDLFLELLLNNVMMFASLHLKA